MKNNRLISSITFYIFITVIMLFINVSAGAQQVEMGFRMDPILVEKNVAPGNSLTYTLNVDNSNKFQTLDLKVSIADVIEDERGTYRLQAAGSTPYSVADMISFEPEQLTIPPGGYKEVEVTVNVPRGSRGGRYGAVVFSTVSEEESPEEILGRTDFTFQAASFLELVISGAGMREEAHITSFNVQKSGEIPALNMKMGDEGLVFGVSVLNSGDVHVVTRGELIIRSEEGRTLARYPLGGGRGVIIPESTVELRSIIRSKNIPQGHYLARAIINYGGHRPLVTEFDFSVDEEKITTKRSEVDIARFIVEPEEVELNFRPGSFKSVILELFNRGEETINIDSSVLPLAFDVYGNLVPLSARKESSQYDHEWLEWITLNPTSFEIAPDRSKRIRLSVRSPREAEGAYYADILFSASSTDTITERGVNILAFAGEEIDKTANLVIREINKNEEYMSIDIVFQNRGNIHVNPELEALINTITPQIIAEDGRITGPGKETLGTFNLPSVENPVLPGTERVYQIIVPELLEGSDYEVVVRADYGAEEPVVTRREFKIEGGTDSEDSK